MRSYILTRNDNVGAAPFDSIAWAYEVHLKERDTREYDFALLVGNNEDSPERIEFWRDEPNYDTPADKIWYASVGAQDGE